MSASVFASMSRRGFLRRSALGAAAAGFGLSPMSQAVASAMDDVETVTWTSCTVNCGSRCPMRVVSKNGVVIRMEPENTGADRCDSPHVRACQRGRSMRQRLYSAERIKYPMKRVGLRGEGRFERISWDEALDTVAAALKKTIATYGNEAILNQYGTGNYSNVSSRNSSQRFLNLIGGCLNNYADYSAAQIQAVWPYLYGGFGYGAHKSKNNGAGSYMSQIAKAKLYVSFGNNNAVTRGSGGGQTYELQCAREAGKTKMILIDPIYTDSMLGKEDEWVPVRPGTDAALVEGMAYVLITEGLVDQQFLDTYCLGYDAKTLPAGAPKNGDYKSYILGKGADKTAKTPAWAAKITGTPEETIVRLARQIGSTKPVFISQGWGSQRQANGEQTARAIAMLAILTGNIGLPGTNSGAREGDSYALEAGLPTGANPVKAAIPCFLWPDAITRATEMTAKRDGVRGVDRLTVPVKFIWNQQGNILINQHGDANRIHKLLQDDKQCEFIVVIDNQMTPSARYADILLPDTLHMETVDFAGDGYATGEHNFIVALQQAVKPQWEQRSTFEICRGLAARFGIEDKFTEGRTQAQWVELCYEETRKKYPELPSYAEFQKRGVVKFKVPEDSGIVLKDFRDDPVKHKLGTPSGKIEIYSERLAKLGQEWELPKGDSITALPQFTATWEMPGDPKQKQFPLQAFGHHGPGRTHSTYHNIPWLRELHPDLLLINPIDAQQRGVKNGDMVQVFNDRGTVQLPAKVSPRIMPGVVSFPQGAWYKPNAKGVDEGACFNTLTSLRPSPLAKGNAVHTNLVEVRKA